MYVIVPSTRVSAFVQSCSEDCNDKQSMFVSHCLKMFECLTQLTQTSLGVVQTQLKVVLQRRLKLTVILQ